VADTNSPPSSEIAPGRSWRHFARALPFASLLLLAGFGRCGDAQPIGTISSDGGAGSGVLVWSDEFDGDAGSPPNPANWTAEKGGDGWGNKQLEYDTDSIENASLDGHGHLAITALQKAYMGNAYTSARINTAGKFEQAYGRFEASLKMPQGQGLWPAFWLLGATAGQPSWPGCGELDIMEAQGQKPTVNHGSMHGPGYSGGGALTAQYGSTSSLAEGFHTYAIDWTANEVDFSVDGTVYEVINKRDANGNCPNSGNCPPGGDKWVFDHPFFVILNVAVGGNFVGAVNATFPQTMLVDYVRVYGPAQ
jgi:beta-glucanase (GH16 family)